IENVDGSLIVKGRELLYAKDKIQLNLDGEVKAVNYDDSENIYNEKGEKTGESLVLDSIVQPSVVTDVKLKVKDTNG
ncbi:flagellar biosynthesis protein FlgD, partial [Aliarcobacter butzleri]